MSRIPMSSPPDGNRRDRDATIVESLQRRIEQLEVVLRSRATEIETLRERLAYWESRTGRKKPKWIPYDMGSAGQSS